MHILLTRQLQDSKDLIQKFKSNGFKVSNLPLLEINKLDYDEIKNYNYNAIIFTSSNATFLFIIVAIIVGLLQIEKKQNYAN